MGRIVSAKIEFEFDEDVANENLDSPMTEDELIDYAIDNFIDDVYSMVKYNELRGAVRAEIKKGQ